MHVTLINRVNALLVHIILALLCCIMRFAFTLLPCSRLQIFGNLVNPLELPWPLVVIQELAMIKAVVISRVILSMICWCESCGLVAVHRVIPAEPDMCLFLFLTSQMPNHWTCCGFKEQKLLANASDAMLIKCLDTWHLVSSRTFQYTSQVDKLTPGQHAHSMHTVHAQLTYCTRIHTLS